MKKRVQQSFIFISLISALLFVESAWAVRRGYNVYSRPGDRSSIFKNTRDHKFSYAGKSKNGYLWVSYKEGGKTRHAWVDKRAVTQSEIRNYKRSKQNSAAVNKIKFPLPKGYKFNNDYRVRTGPSLNAGIDSRKKAKNCKLTGFQSENKDWVETRCPGHSAARWIHRKGLEVTESQPEKSERLVDDSVPPGGEVTSTQGEKVQETIPLPIKKTNPSKLPVHKDFTNNKLPKTDRSKGRDMAEIPQGVCRSFTYNPRGGEPDMRWSYAHPVSGCAYMALLQKWNKVCEKMQPSLGVKQRGCRVAQGHISKKNGWGYESHRTHTHGHCFDLRPFRKGNFRNAPLTVRSGAYSRKFTKKFLQLAREFGSDTTYLNDRKIIRSGLSRHAGGHHNHIHICFKPKSKTRKACKKWKPDPNVCPRAGGWVKMLKKRGYLK